MEKEYKKIISFLKNYQTHTNARGYVLGISGGKDSTIVAKLLVDAIGKENVLGVLMPNGEQKDISDSLEVCKYLDIRHILINISHPFTSLLSSIERTTLEKSIDVGIPNLVSDGSSIIISDKACSTL